MQYKIILETRGEMRLTIDVPGATGAEKDKDCKASIWTDSWPKPEADLCGPEIPCARCTAIRAVQEHVLPSADGFKIKIDRLKPVVTKEWATGGGEEPR